ncbi:unnamed protein product [Colias eurytheme]|nr:unnamed protein product [Colias eurytheme]
MFADIVTQFKHIIEDKRTGGMFIQRKKDAWKAITDKYNSNCYTGRREMDQLKALYDNMKQKARKNIGESNKTEYINRIPLELSEEDLSRALKNLREDKVQMNKTGGGCYKPKTTDSESKILAIIQDQVEPLCNPFDSGALYFKDATHLSEPTGSKSPEIENFIVVNEVEKSDSSNLLDTEITRYQDSSMVTLTQEADISELPKDQPNLVKRKMLKTINRKKQKAPVNLKPRNKSSEELKRIYFKKKCQNANLERKKLMQEILQNKEQHRLKMLILKKQFECK